MPTVVADLVARLRADATGLVGGLAESDAALEKTSATSAETSSKVSAGGALMIAALVGVGVEAVKMASQFETAHARLTTAVTNTGGSMTVWGGKIDATDARLEKLGFTGTDTEAAMASLVGATHSVSVATGLMGEAADIARGRHIDLGAATQLLVKVETGHVALLGRLGINTKDATGATITSTEAVKRLAALYGGNAQAYAQTFAGKLAVLRAEGEHLGVTIGEKIIPVLEGMASGTLVVVSALETFNTATDGVAGKTLLFAAAGTAAYLVLSKLYAGVVLLGGKIIEGATAIGLHSAATETDTAATAAAIDGQVAYAAALAASNEAEIALVTAVLADEEAKTGAAVAGEALVEVQLQMADGAGITAAAESALVFALGDVAAAGAIATDTAAALAAADQAAAAAAAEAAAANAADAAAMLGVGVAGEEAGVGLTAMLGPIGLAVAAAVALAVGLYKVIGAMSTESDHVTDLSKGLLGTATDANRAAAALGAVVGPDITSGLVKYSQELLSGADKATLAATKQQTLNGSMREAAVKYLGASEAAKMSDADLTRLSQTNELFGRRVQETNADVEQATSTMQKLVDKYGLAAIQNQQLSDAQKTYADLLASGTASADQLATAHDNVVAAATRVANVQHDVSAATALGTSAIDKQAAAQKQAKADADALAKADKALTDVFGPQAAAAIEASGATTGALQQMADEGKKMADSVKSSVSRADDVFGSMPDSVQSSFDKITFMLISQANATANWATNVALLVKSGLDKGIIQNIIDAGPKSAVAVQTMVDHMTPGWVSMVNNATLAANRAAGSIPAALAGIDASAATQAAIAGAIAGASFVGSFRAAAQNGLNRTTFSAAFPGQVNPYGVGQGSPATGQHGMLVNGPTHVLIGEAGFPEVVLPLGGSATSQADRARLLAEASRIAPDLRPIAQPNGKAPASPLRLPTTTGAGSAHVGFGDAQGFHNAEAQYAQAYVAWHRQMQVAENNLKHVEHILGEKGLSSKQRADEQKIKGRLEAQLKALQAHRPYAPILDAPAGPHAWSNSAVLGGSGGASAGHSGQVTIVQGGITVNMPPGSDGEDVVAALNVWMRSNGPVPIAVTGSRNG